MKIRNYDNQRPGMLMLAPDTGTIDTPAAMTPVADVFEAALAKEKGKEAPVKEEPTATEPEAKPSKAAPKSALDAALGDDVPATDKPEPAADEDPLKAFSEEKPDWKNARALIKKQHGELRELREKAGKSEADPAIISELSTLKQALAERDAALAERDAKLADYNDAMTAVNLELHPDFRREFIDGRKELVQAAASKFKAYGGNPEALSEALSMPEGKRRDAAIEEALSSVDDMSATAKAKILTAVAEVESLDEKRDKRMKEPQQAYEELERRTLAQRQKQQQEAEQLKATEFERITRELQKSVRTLAPVDESFEGGKEWNAQVKEARERGFALLAGDAPFEKIVAAAVKGEDYDRVTSLLMAERKETATLRAQLAELDGAIPDIKGGKAPKKSPLDASLEKSPGDLYNEAMSKLGRTDDD